MIYLMKEEITAGFLTRIDRARGIIQWRKQWAAKVRAEANPQISSQFGLKSATRLHERGMHSNRGEEPHGEIYLG